MKIRWTAGSIRLRITPSELQSVADQEIVAEALVLGGTPVWKVEIIPAKDGSSLDGDAGQALVIIRLGPEERAILLASDTEGVYLLDTNSQMRYYIEKDFPCAHPRPSEAAELATETFAPPEGFLERKKLGSPEH